MKFLLIFQIIGPGQESVARIGSYAIKVTDYVASGSFKSLRENVKYYKSSNYALLVKTQDFQNNFSKDLTYTDENGYKFLSNSNLYGGELILSNVGSIGKCFIVPKLNIPMTLAPNSIMVRFFDEKLIGWFLSIFQSTFGLKLLLSISSATAIKKFNKTDFKSLLVPIPPIKEQIRIIDYLNSFEPLLKHYQDLENKISTLESSFEEKLKSSILQYAIEGKLVKQDPSDEPASVLLERIKFEKEKLIKEGKIKRDKNEYFIYQSDDKNYYEKLPASWKTISLNDVCSLISRGKTPKYSDNGKVLVLAQKCNQWDGIHLDRCLKTETSELIRYTDSYLLKVGDIVINSTGGGTVGRTGYVSNSIIKEQQVVWDTHITVVRPMLKMNSKFVYLFLISPIIQTGIEKKCEGSTNQIELYPKVIKSYRIPLPPLNEQSKIVNKIDKIFSSI